MMRRYPCLFECRDGSLYLVLEDPSSASLADISGDIRSIVVRLDGEPTTWADTSQVFHTLTMETLDRMLSAFQCLSGLLSKSRFSTARAGEALDCHACGGQASRQERKQDMSRTKRNRRFQYANQHASIQTRPNLAAQVGGESFTANREDELAASIYTDSSNATSFAVKLGGAELTLSGRQARTIQRLLNKHYSSCGAFTLDQPGV